MKASQDTVDHATPLLIAVAIRQFNCLVECNRRRGVQIGQIHNGKSKNVPVDPGSRSSASSPSPSRR